MTETLAPVSTKASTQTSSMKTVNVFDWDLGGLEDFCYDAVSLHKTAAFSFPSAGRQRERQGEEETTTGGKAKVTDVGDSVVCMVGHRSPEGSKSDG